jgi:hypothetical protein
MSTEKSKWVDAVAKLIELTQEGGLKWTIDEPPASLSRRPDARVELVFVAKYGEKSLRLYERRFQEEFIDFNEFEMRPVPKTEWRKAVVLEFVDDNGNSLWAFPSVEALNDLMSAVQYQAAGVKDFLTELLAAS